MPNEKDDRVIIAQFKGTPDFKRWMKDVSNKKGMSVAKFIEYAVRETASRDGLSSVVPNRTSK